MSLSEKQPKRSTAAGFGVMELLIVIALVGIVSTIAFINFQKSTRSLNVAAATRNLTVYLEKARVDSVRRHGGASVAIDSTSSYTATIDFDGSGIATARTINLPAGTTLTYTLPPATTTMDPSVNPITITYDWRGRATNTVLLTLTDSTDGVAPSSVVVGLAGDLSTDSTVTGPVTIPTPQNTTVTTTNGVKSMFY